MTANMESIYKLAGQLTRSYSKGVLAEDRRQEVALVMWQAMEAVESLKDRLAKRDKSAWGYLRTAGVNKLRGISRKELSGKRYVDLTHHTRLAESVQLFSMWEREEKKEMVSTFPPCHPLGLHSEGYDPSDSLCHNCADKVSCLVQTPSVPLDVDAEVRLVVASKHDPSLLKLSHIRVKDRQRERIRLEARDTPIPDRLQVHNLEMLPPSRPKKSHKEETKGAQMDPFKMLTKIHQIKISQPFDLEIGHVLVRYREDQQHIQVELREEGFFLNLDQTLYRSLSGAAKAAYCFFGGSPKSKRPGNDFFNLRRQNTAIIDGDTGAVLALKGSR